MSDIYLIVAAIGFSYVFVSLMYGIMKIEVELNKIKWFLEQKNPDKPVENQVDRKPLKK